MTYKYCVTQKSSHTNLNKKGAAKITAPSLFKTVVIIPTSYNP